MRNTIVNYIKNDEFSNPLEINQLHKMSDNNPWKKYENYSPKEFVSENFRVLKEELPLFYEKLPNFILDVAFVKYYNEILKRDYWFCIYYFGEKIGLFDELEIQFLIGGEPEKDVKIPEIYKKNWTNFPNDIKKFWAVHALFKNSLHGDDSFGLDYINKSLKSAEFSGDLSHFLTFEKSKINLDKSHDLDSKELEDVWIELSDSDLKNYTYDYEYWDEKGLAEFLKHHIKYAILLDHIDNGNLLFLVKSFEGLPQYLNFSFYRDSYFYPSFWQMISSDIEDKLFGIATNSNTNQEFSKEYIQKKLIDDGKTLNLQGAGLAKIPEIISSFKGLEILDLTNNDIQTIPNFIFEMTSLKELHLGYNNIKILPENITKLQQLTKLDLALNKISRTPKFLHKMPNLQFFCLRENKIERVDFGENYLKMRNLEVNNNKLKYIPQDKKYLKDVHFLNVSAGNVLRTENVHTSWHNESTLNFLNAQAILYKIDDPNFIWRVDIVNHVYSTYEYIRGEEETEIKRQSDYNKPREETYADVIKMIEEKLQNGFKIDSLYKFHQNQKNIEMKVK